MKILFISQSDFDGGASLAAHKLAHTLKSKGVDITMFVMQSDNHSEWILSPKSLMQQIIVKIFGRIESALNKTLTTKKSGYWSFNFLPNPLIRKIDFNSYDIVHIHWIGKNTLSLKLLSKIDTRIVWTLHDSWVFTGGCHLPLNCTKFRDECDECPQLNKCFQDVAVIQHVKKKKLFETKNITCIAPSSWMRTQAESSQLLKNFNIELIHNGISSLNFVRADTNFFKFKNKISDDEIVIVFGGYNAVLDLNKGFIKLINAINILTQKNKSKKYTVLTFGTSDTTHLSKLPFRLINFKIVRNQSFLNEIYSCAHLTAIPSFSESFGQMAVESLYCGTPVVAFKTSGLIDIIEHKLTGYLAKPYDELDFATGIDYLQSRANDNHMQIQCRDIAVSKFDFSKISAEHIHLYNRLINEK